MRVVVYLFITVRGYNGTKAFVYLCMGGQEMTGKGDEMM
jgi:hypothetical protein